MSAAGAIKTNGVDIASLAPTSAMSTHREAVRGCARLFKPPVRHRAAALATTRCSVETEKLFTRRLEAQGWDKVRSSHFVDIGYRGQGLHPLVAETWKAMNQVYGAGVLETPLEPAPWLAEAAGGGATTVSLKLETHQVTGSFKARGAAHKLMSLTPEQLQRGVVTSSTGNHALATLHACAAMTAAGQPVHAEIIVPSTLSAQKAAKLHAAASKSGACVVTHGTDCVEAEAEARRRAESSGRVYISPYNDVEVAGGQGTLGVELLMALPPQQLDVVFVPVGGGGLIAGVAALLKALHPSVRIYGCQPERSDVMRRSVAAGRVVELPWAATLSDGTAGGVEEGTVTLEACSRFVDEWVVVGEEDIAAAMVGVAGHHGVLIEGAAGVAVAAYLKSAQQMRGQHAVVVCCGGNVSQETMDEAYKLVGQRRGATSSMSDAPM